MSEYVLNIAAESTTKSRSTIMRAALAFSLAVFIAIGVTCSLSPKLSALTTGTFGNTTIGASCSQFTNDYKRVNKYAVNVTATVTQLSIYLKPGPEQGSQSIKGILYADNNGQPGSLIATTAQLTYTSSSATKWYNLAFGTPPTITPGNYWIGAITGPTANVIGYCYATGSSTANASNNNEFANGPSNPFGSPTWDNKIRSLYATYTVPSSGGTPSVVLTANPTTITAKQSSTLTWSSTNATSCSASWTGSTATKGTQAVMPSTSTNYLIVCNGSGGSATAQATVTVQQAPSPPSPPPPPSSSPPPPSPTPTSTTTAPSSPAATTTVPLPPALTSKSQQTVQSRSSPQPSFWQLAISTLYRFRIVAGAIAALFMLLFLLVYRRRHADQSAVISESQEIFIPQSIDSTVAELFPFL